jgi:hypothetical protein
MARVHTVALTRAGAGATRGDSGMPKIYVIDEQISGPNALWIEDKRHDVGADRDGDVADLLDQPKSESFTSIFGRGFSEELPSTTRVDICSQGENSADSRLIR